MSKEYLRFRCPFCGMMPFLDHVDFNTPYPPILYLQTIGGSEALLTPEEKQLPRQQGRRGVGRPLKVKKIRGLISFEPITEGSEYDDLKARIKIKTKILSRVGSV